MGAALVAAIATRAAAAAPDAGTLRILYLGRAYDKPVALSLMQSTPDDLGIAGAKLALAEINTTGQFLGRHFAMDVVQLPHDKPAGGFVMPDLSKYAAVTADLDAEDQLALAALPAAAHLAVLDDRTEDDRLRQRDCKANVFHLLPDRAMRADAIGQYLAWKQWPHWALLRGEGDDNAEMAADIRRSAERFGGKIVSDRVYRYDPGSRRVDTGYQQVQTQMPQATQDAGDYDVVFVADEHDLFGDYLPYNTKDARPVVGTQGLVASAWTPAFQDYSALQMQHRFTTKAGRQMQERDYSGWLAVRIVGEANFRGNAADGPSVQGFLRSSQFNVAGFKGQSLTFRSWDQQLRQPVLLASPIMVVSMSPQDGFLSPDFLTDTLGFDKSESGCRW